MLMSLGLFAPPASANIKPDQQWYLDAMNASGLWKVSKGKGVTVAVVDSGVKPIPGLEDRLLPGKSFAPKAPDPHGDVSGHGTEMAALIAGSGVGNSLRGLAPEAKILPVRTHTKADFVTSWDKTLVNAIRYAARSDAKVINISQGVSNLDDETLAEMQDAIDEANERGKLIFVASGNDGRRVEKRDYPAVLPGVVPVGAVDETGTVADFSNYGPHLVLSAPGDPGGTSVASAVASASAALIWAEHPDWTNHQVLRVMVETTGRSQRGEEPSMYLGHGIVRPAQVLVDGDGDPGPADVSPIFSKYYASLEASKSPSPEDGEADGKNEGPPTAKPGKAQEQDDEQVAAQEETGDSGPPWTAIGIGAAVLVAVAAIVTAMAFRRRTPAQPRY
ncbi:S8 family serine peptidase [Streptomyces chitinivorans]|uniref:S8 family serine peptidase n=1 Tax=Streptomyces chitinivorans TaxID=1257027 RepID=A0ABW7I183_9ACTN|nr:S8 family serine peptidase [Streptomyces chitinivorans]MDH2412141.1 S8 family serine peptidase [Streptomyces chitinivorans]